MGDLIERTPRAESSSRKSCSLFEIELIPHIHVLSLRKLSHLSLEITLLRRRRVPLGSRRSRSRRLCDNLGLLSLCVCRHGPISRLSAIKKIRINLRWFKAVYFAVVSLLIN
jgi:hypothetical protein